MTYTNDDFIGSRLRGTPIAAFPRPGFSSQNNEAGCDSLPYDGMSLRDWFAGQAIAGSQLKLDNPYTGLIARQAYKQADAMLEEREKETR